MILFGRKLKLTLITFQIGRPSYSSCIPSYSGYFISSTIFNIQSCILALSLVAFIDPVEHLGFWKSLLSETRPCVTPMISRLPFLILHTGPPESPQHVPWKYIDGKRYQDIRTWIINRIPTNLYQNLISYLITWKPMFSLCGFLNFFFIVIIIVIPPNNVSFTWRELVLMTYFRVIVQFKFLIRTSSERGILYFLPNGFKYFYVYLKVAVLMFQTVMRIVRCTGLNGEIRAL